MSDSNIPVKNVYQRQLGDVGDIESPLECWLDRRVVEYRLAAEEHAQVSLFGGTEGLQRVCIGFDDISCSRYPVVQDDHGSSVSGGGISGKRNSLQQVRRTI